MSEPPVVLPIQYPHFESPVRPKVLFPVAAASIGYFWLAGPTSLILIGLVTLFLILFYAASRGRIVLSSGRVQIQSMVWLSVPAKEVAAVELHHVMEMSYSLPARLLCIIPGIYEVDKLVAGLPPAVRIEFTHWRFVILVFPLPLPCFLRQVRLHLDDESGAALKTYCESHSGVVNIAEPVTPHLE